MRVVVPVEILEGRSVAPGLAQLLEPVDVTLLGYHDLPDQTPPDQARAQFGDRAKAALDDLAAEFPGAVETRMVFTSDAEDTVDRVAADVGADAHVVPGVVGDVDRLLVSLTGDVDVERVLAFVEALVADRDVAVTLLRVAQDGGTDEDGIESAAERLEAAGVDVADQFVVEGSPLEELLAVAEDHDAIALGESAPSLSSFVLGEPEERVAKASLGPVLVVRRPSPEE